MASSNPINHNHHHNRTGIHHKYMYMTTFLFILHCCKFFSISHYFWRIHASSGFRAGLKGLGPQFLCCPQFSWLLIMTR